MRCLYEIHTSSKSANSIAKGTNDLYGAIRSKHEYKQNLISHHLDYLIQKGWVTEEVLTSTFTKDGVSIPQTKKRYKISYIGIEKYEDGSVFHHIKNDSSFNISSINSVIVVGNGNIVNANYSELSQKLTDLHSSILKSSSLSEEQKLNALADLATIQNQLSKTKPERGIIKSAWETLKGIATISGAVSLCEQIGKLIQSV